MDHQTGDLADAKHARLAGWSRQHQPVRGNGGFIADRLRALPNGPAVVLTSSAGRCRFTSQLDNYRFVAKADLRVQALQAGPFRVNCAAWAALSPQRLDPGRALTIRAIARTSAPRKLRALADSSAGCFKSGRGLGAMLGTVVC